jgi:hypothetical protein
MMMMMTEGREGVDSGVCFSFWFSFFLSFCMDERAAFLNHIMVYTVQRYGTAGGVECTLRIKLAT